MDKGKATAIARSSIRKWMAKSKHPEVRAAAGVAEAQEIAAQARAHAHAATWGELADVIDLAWIAHPTAAQYAVIDARTGHPWWKDGGGGKAKAPAKVTASALVTHHDGTVTGGAGKVKVGSLAHENGKWVARHGDGTTTKHAVRGVALKALAAHHNARAAQPAPASHTPAATPPEPSAPSVAPAAVTPEAAAKPPAKITAASLVVHQDGSVAHKQSGAKVGTLSHENGKWAARHSDGTVSKHSTRQVALQAIAARHNKAAMPAPAGPKAGAGPKAAPKAAPGILTGSHPADKMTVASDKQAAARSLSDDDLKRADTELARRAAMLGKPGQQSKGHEAVAAEMKRRAAEKVTAPAKAPAPAAAKAPAVKAPKRTLTGAAIHDELGKPVLSADQEAALSAYQSPTPDTGYINDNLHGRTFGAPAPEAAAKRQIAAMDSAFDRAKPTSAPMTLYRGLSGTDLSVGRVFSDDGYVSATSEPKVADGFGNKVVRIHVPAGSKALSLALMAGENPRSRLSHNPMGITDEDTGDTVEREALLPRGSQFKVTGKSGKYIDVELMPASADPAPAAKVTAPAKAPALPKAVPAAKEAPAKPAVKAAEAAAALPRVAPPKDEAEKKRLTDVWVNSYRYKGTSGYTGSDYSAANIQRGKDFATEMNRLLTANTPPKSSDPGVKDAHQFLAMVDHDATAHKGELQRAVSLDAADAKRMFQPGKTMDMPVASWTSKESRTGYYTSDDPGKVTVLLHTAPGAKGLDLAPLAPNSITRNEQEVVTGGRFSVDKVKTTGGVMHVYVTQQGFSAN
jgi:ADP-ribosyltransferase exoenzyme